MPAAALLSIERNNMKDKAYIIGNDPAMIDEIVKREGLWLCVDPGKPDQMIPIWSKDGKLYAMVTAQELKPSGFYSNVKFWGPLTPQDVI